MPLVDSHCHLDFAEFASQLPQLLDKMSERDVAAAVCIGVNLESWPAIQALAATHAHLFASVGVHPDATDCHEPTVDELVALADSEKVIAVGETGLDYYRLTGDLTWQRDRFRRHIRAGIRAGKPLVVHTRAAAQDTLAVMREEGADRCGGIMHCFTESWPVAQAALDLGFFLSFSGIVSFRSAEDLREVARKTPRDRILVETDSPYLAPVPYRGKTNQPAFVREVAEAVAHARGETLADVAAYTTENFMRLFPSTRPVIESHRVR